MKDLIVTSLILYSILIGISIISRKYEIIVFSIQTIIFIAIVMILLNTINIIIPKLRYQFNLVYYNDIDTIDHNYSDINY